MKKFIVRGKSDVRVPNKLIYGSTYWMGFAAVAHEGFTFKLNKGGKTIIIKDDSGQYLESKKWLRNIMRSGMLQFLVEIEPEE